MPAALDQRRLVEAFRERFPGARPRWYVRAPGRVNLIGEHTDYNGFPVMPMALDLAIYVVAAPSGDRTVELGNLEPGRYGDRRFEVSTDIASYSAGNWGNYVKAAVQSLTRLQKEQGSEPRTAEGMRCIVGGTLPPASNLSSSSALLVASALAYAACNGWQEQLSETAQARCVLAERAAVAEHYVGTQGGGMDQAVCLLAQAGCALRIDFFPLRVRTVPFPEGYVILAAHSTVSARKAKAQRLAFNRRVLECAIGGAMLARRLAVPQTTHLGELCRADGAPAPTQTTELLAEITGGRESLTLEEAAALLEMTPERFADRHLRAMDGSILPTPRDGLKVLPRCRHVFSEAQRTEAATAHLCRADARAVGQLMDESHESCARDYEISSPELDALVRLMRKAGALGARLTGAGFGGFAIALVETGGIEAIRDILAEEFYQPRGISPEGNLFVFTPAAGAEVQSL